MNTTTKYMTNGSFYENRKPKKNTESTCDLQLKSLILNASNATTINDFYDPNLKLYVYPLTWSNTLQPIQCPILSNDELAESARIIFGENNTRELIDSDIPLCTLSIQNEHFEIHLLLLAITFKDKGIIENRLFDKIERIVIKSNLNKLVKQSTIRDTESIETLIEKLRADLLKLSEYIHRINCLIYRPNIQPNHTIIALKNNILHTKINIRMSTDYQMALSPIPDINGTKLRHKTTRGLKEHLERTTVPMSLSNSVVGDIESVLFALSATTKGATREHYLSIVREFAKTISNVQLIMVVEMDADKLDAQSWKERIEKEMLSLRAVIPPENNTTLKVVKIGVQRAKDSFSIWIQDALMSATAEDGTKYLLTPLHPKRHDRRNDGSIAKKVADSEFGYRLRTFDLQLEGGNVLVADDFILIGKDEVLDNNMSEKDFLYYFKQYTGDERPVIFVEIPQKKYETPRKPKPLEGKERAIGQGLYIQEHYHSIYNWRGVEQPIYHLDVFMTPLGYNEVGEYELLVGQPVAGFDYHATETEDHVRKTFYSQMKDAQERIDDSIEHLKKIFTQKFNKSLKIHRNPMPLTFEQKGNDYYWYWATYNNCIIQNGTHKTVWLPTYGHDDKYNTHWNYLKKYDKENQEIFDNLGFKPHLLNVDFHPFAEKNGSLHCLTKSILKT